MKLRSLVCALILALFAFQTIPVSAVDEGMWTFNNVPKVDIKQKYGFDVTDEWLRKVQLASVRFPNGSGSFVSPNGLVLTNYHIVEKAIGDASTAEKDYAKEGFVAHNQAEELKAPDLFIDVLMSIEDVTDRVNAAVKADMSAAEANAARGATIRAIETESNSGNRFAQRRGHALPGWSIQSVSLQTIQRHSRRVCAGVSGRVFWRRS